MASSRSDARGARAALLALAASVALGSRAAAAQAPGAAPPAAAQEPRPDLLEPEPDAPVGTLPDGTRRVVGRVVTPRDSALAGVPGVWVTLHRVGRDAAGPVDSVRSGAGGAYALRYRPTGAADAVYFVAASRGGVAYFSAPLRAAEVRGEAAEVTVFDTTSRPVPLTVRGRHLIVAAPNAEGAREVLEVFELSNDSSVTAVPAAGGTRGVWSTPLPAGVARVQVRESGDVPGDGLAVLGGAAALMVPVAPGVKQVAFSYQLPAGGLPLRVPVAGAAGLLEVLLEEPGAGAEGGGLAAVAPVALEGKSFRRYLAQEVPAGATVTVSPGAAAARPAARVAVPAILAVVGGGMAAALVAAGVRRRPRGAPRAAPMPHVPAPHDDPAASAATLPPRAERERLLRELAALDDAYAADAHPAPGAHDAYAARRADLKTQLGAALAGAAAPD